MSWLEGKSIKGDERQVRLIYAQDASAPSKLPVFAPVVYFADAELPESGGAHDAGFDRHVQDRISQEVRVPGCGVIVRGKKWIGEDVIYCF